MYKIYSQIGCADCFVTPGVWEILICYNHITECHKQTRSSSQRQCTVYFEPWVIVGAA